MFTAIVLADQESSDYDLVPSYEHDESWWYQKHRLFRSYFDQSEDQLSEFFRAWSVISKPITDGELEKLPQAFTHTYKIFEDFYQPKNLSRIGEAEWGDKQFSDATYFVTQSEIDVVVSTEFVADPVLGIQSPNIFKATLKNFRPKVKGEINALYLDNNHESALREFLGEDKAPVGHNGIMSTSKSIGESKKRQEYLNRYIKIYEGHWSGWRLITDPTITTINFNENYDRAIVYFSLVYEGGQAEYQLKNGKWALIKSELTWIT